MMVGNLAKYIIITSGLVLLFNLFGLIGQTSLVQLLMNPSNYTQGQLYLGIIAMLGIIALATAVSFFTSGSFKIDFLMVGNVGIVTWLLTMLNELLAIFIAIAQGSGLVAILIVGILFIPYTLAVIDWWRGTST